MASDTVEKVWQDYQAQLRVFVRGRLDDPAASDDILQDIFLKINSGLANVKDEAK